SRLRSTPARCHRVAEKSSAMVSADSQNADAPMTVMHKAVRKFNAKAMATKSTKKHKNKKQISCFRLPQLLLPAFFRAFLCFSWPTRLSEFPLHQLHAQLLAVQRRPGIAARRADRMGADYVFHNVRAETGTVRHMQHAVMNLQRLRN